MSETDSENRQRAEEIVARSQEIARELGRIIHDSARSSLLLNELHELTNELIARVNREL
jgi:hypothetical protein